MAITTEELGKGLIKSTIERVLKPGSSQDLLSLLAVKSEEDYQRGLLVMEYLMLNTEDSPENPYHLLMDLLSKGIAEYEQEHYVIEKASPLDVLKALMEENGLTQGDLPEIGNQAKVSEVLSGKRKLNLRQIKALSERFRLAPSVFI